MPKEHGFLPDDLKPIPKTLTKNGPVLAKREQPVHQFVGIFLCHVPKSSASVSIIDEFGWGCDATEGCIQKRSYSNTTGHEGHDFRVSAADRLNANVMCGFGAHLRSVSQRVR